MKHIPLTTLCVAISAVLLTACGGSGGSNPPAPTPIPNAGSAGNAGGTGNTGGTGSTDNVGNAGGANSGTGNAGNSGNANSGTGSANTPEPKYQDVPTDKNEKEQVSSIQEPAMGYAMELKLRNAHPLNPNKNKEAEKRIALDQKDLVAVEGDLTNIPFDKNLIEYLKKSSEVVSKFEAQKGGIENNTRLTHKDLSSEQKEAKVKEALDNALTQFAQEKYKELIENAHDKKSDARNRDLEYVKSGFNYLSGYTATDHDKKTNYRGYYGALYYKGSETAKELPQTSAKYKGYWDFMTDATLDNKYTDLPGIARQTQWRSLVSTDEYATLLTDKNNKPSDYNGAYGHSSEFDVNFADKKIKGKLISNQLSGTAVTAKERYKIEADIHGNRFRGSATASDKAEDSKTQHPFTSDATNKLEGGFYGPKGEELAGKFLTDDNKLFGVFGAKRDKVEKTEAILDAYALGTFNNTNKATTFTPFTKKQLDNFGNAKKLVLGSTVINLVSTGAAKDVNEFKEKPKSATNKAGETLMVNDEVIVKTYGYGKNFEYLKFGELSVGDSHSVFLQGERTATTGDKAVPTTGKAKYLGNWVGYITGTGTGKSFNEAQDVADFDIDFASKTVNGKLITKDRKDPVFNITGQIAGNGWTGKASTAKANAGGYNIDSSSSTNKSIVIENANVTGGFYGPNANEMGGSFTHDTNDSKASVVFGTKKQEVKP
ncbi:transferrin-binding protein-like solute binding protein [Moraxella catarrhalis]|uniref:Transferrin-binding protein B n=1 Tax=Moraxella catarrhalis TaxID=480 RepID=A0A3S9QGX0_MORCA|nr:transferrin-binding protein-like solute binding protein [Moraxella catarrhalis]AZQ93890.1 transferrin binding protein-like solute binding family protein [Moraxella catarrhalis]AZQ95682.1 transferrin binding protein-like solute binding family protein [Moraxella catarrhalis]MPW67066.1 transferrin-binding protein-like solute binding protein [Moraxella catarrhalis]MPX45095.1 transferrin-binding protein-like solute binding protein [Moraxella catarrhalis]MPX55481.1 transferrin-binding protein-lik